MALLRSVRKGTRAVTWRDWVFAYLTLWAAPLLVGMALSALAILWRWPFDAMGTDVPAEDTISAMLGLGLFLMMVPVFSWIGLVISFPVVWLVLKLGLGGWLSFALGGVAMALAASAMIGGMAPEIPMVTGVLSAMALRWLLKRRKPDVFDLSRDNGAGHS